ncbi:hypothetical protein [Aquimonas sp.]|uniref:hypothetical protein n=1 Tax=Aquimonas sp. TaxID=1872588 RepID=UPI0037BFE27E
MNEILTREADPSDLTSIPTAELRLQLAQAIGVTARTLGHLAAIWRELEDRGEDLSDLRSGLMSYLPLIAEGRLDPEAVVRCAGQAMLLRAIAELPIGEQRRLLTEGVMVAQTNSATGQHESILRPLERLSSADVRRVFAVGYVRPPAEQLVLLVPPPAANRSRSVIVKVRLTQDEYQQLRQAAAQRGQTVPTRARDILLDATRADRS